MIIIDIWLSGSILINLISHILVIIHKIIIIFFVRDIITFSILCIF